MRDVTYDVKTLTFRHDCYMIVSMIHKTLWSSSFCGSLYTHTTSTAANNTSPCQALHSGIAICSPRSATPTFWSAGIVWSHMRPSLQSQTPLQACRLLLNAPGCPAISVRTPHCRKKTNARPIQTLTGSCFRPAQERCRHKVTSFFHQSALKDTNAICDFILHCKSCWQRWSPFEKSHCAQPLLVATVFFFFMWKTTKSR